MTGTRTRNTVVLKCKSVIKSTEGQSRRGEERREWGKEKDLQAERTPNLKASSSCYFSKKEQKKKKRMKYQAPEPGPNTQHQHQEQQKQEQQKLLAGRFGFVPVERKKVNLEEGGKRQRVPAYNVLSRIFISTFLSGALWDAVIVV
ncbi:hypothetical protein M0802_011129 [Mischocyttarus mexicanus]|nr:hypothetical protein M0802_011129 [Mischocyttarus mexicanus]